MNLTLNWDKSNGLLPAIIQNANTNHVLMLGYMNQASLAKTLATKRVTFYSRSKQRLWVKGETSGNALEVVSIYNDCDNDTLLIKAIPTGPICHKGDMTCFGAIDNSIPDFISTLEAVIAERERSRPENSYIAKLFMAGMDRMAQKVGEEGVEVALAAVSKNDETLCSEAADLLFHLLILLKARKLSFSDVIAELKKRNCLA